MPRLNVLITAASRRVPLVQAFQRALRQPRLGGDVIVTDVNPLSPAVHIADRAYRVPYAHEPDYLDVIREICLAHDVGLVIPTIDDELPRFSEEAAAFAAIGARVAISPVDTTSACNDKLMTCERLRAAGVSAARTLLPHAVREDTSPLPLFIKPRGGRGGVNAFRASTWDEVRFFATYVPDAVVQQFLDGPEFTIDMLCDFDGRPLVIVPRERVVVRAGVIDRGRTVFREDLIALALACARVFRFVGAVNIQCRDHAGQPTVFEINPRFSGGIPLTIAAGADVPALLIDLALGRAVEPRIGAFTPNLWMTSYESSFFVTEETCALDAPPAPVPARALAS